MDERVEAHAPGRVNLLGDHTDHAGGLALPMAVDLGTTVTGRRGGTAVRLRSDAEPTPADLSLPPGDVTGVTPPWARYVAAVAAEVRPAVGFEGRVTTTLPVGAGLSSSAALEVATALALGYQGPPLALARLCQRAEQAASGVPCGLMDQLTSVCGREGHALLIDFADDSFEAVPFPDDLEVVVVHSGQPRALAASAYAERRAACERAAALVGPLPEAGPAELAALRATRSSPGGPATSPPSAPGCAGPPTPCAPGTPRPSAR